jgi:hypothetical protein
MPTKTDRILSYLPGTFQADPRPAALYAVTDAFGSELQLGENSLAAILLSHWVDFADKNAEAIDDLARIASLYGLAPRDDETVEEFRDHLKRYVRTFLDGTVTVQGVLRVTAEALGLRIADSYDDLDSWWKRREEILVTTQLRGDDAANLVFGMRSFDVRGVAARAAEVTGSSPVAGAALPAGAVIRLIIDGGAPRDITLPAGPADPNAIVAAINSGAGQAIATMRGPLLRLASPTTGASSRLEVPDVSNDAAPALLGLAPRLYHGREAAAAKLTGTVDLSGGADLSHDRYLRLIVDGTHVAEIDCAGAPAEHTPLDHIRDAINSGIGVNVARHDGKFLTLESETKGARSVIAVQPATSQDASLRLFGVAAPVRTGNDAQPARVTGSRDVSKGVDLSKRSLVRLRIDGEEVTTDCAGVNPAGTQPFEIVTAINAAFKGPVSSVSGGSISLVSRTAGPAAEIALLAEPNPDAVEDILGIGPRVFTGSDATTARFTGGPDLTAGADLAAQRFIALSIDGQAEVEVDLAAKATDLRAVKLKELAGAINDAAETNVASDDGHHLILSSPSSGAVSAVTVHPLETTLRRKFVTRAMVIDEAAQPIFGFVKKEAEGAPATHALIAGTPDLSRGVDLRERRYLRLVVDGRPAVEIDCAGTRPRATLLSDVVSKINNALVDAIASDDGQHLILRSPKSGAVSQLAFEPPHTADALGILLGVAPGTYRGQEATRLSFTGLVDLGAGIDLAAHASIKLKIDAVGPVEIDLGGDAGGHKSISDLAAAINVAMGSFVCIIAGPRLVLNSAEKGADSKIEFSTPAGPDATAALFGVNPPRAYVGAPGLPAEVVGTVDRGSNADLRASRFLRISVDGEPVKEIDCSARAADPSSVELKEIVTAINDALGRIIASDQGSRLKLTSPTVGVAGRVTLEPHSSGDASAILLGNDLPSATGTDAAPATITGEADLLGPVNLSKRQLVRVAVNGGQPVDIDVAGRFPGATTPDEIVTAINRVFPALASVTDDDHLRLTAPGREEASQLALLPLRYIESIEYTGEAIEESPRQVRPGDGWYVLNTGATFAYAEIELSSPSGTVGPTLVNMSVGWIVQVFADLNAGDALRLRRTARGGMEAAVVSPDGTRRVVPASKITVGPIGGQAIVPFDGAWKLTGDPGQAATLQLNNPLSDRTMVLRVRSNDADMAVSVQDHDTSADPAPAFGPDGSSLRLTGALRYENHAFVLVDKAGATIALVRAGAQLDLQAYGAHPVAATGVFYSGSPGSLIASQVARLFDVTINDEKYTGVTIAEGDGADSLARQVNAGAQFGQFSKLVTAEELDKGTVLLLVEERADWLYLDCAGARYNQAHFNVNHFPNGRCEELGVFNVSRFANSPPENVVAVYAGDDRSDEFPAIVTMRWTRQQAGSFTVNLPLDLPARFGARFNESRFGQSANSPELFAPAVAEPPTDERFLVRLINNDPAVKGNQRSQFVDAAVVQSVPLGWAPVRMPFRKPQPLTLGSETVKAALYLSEEGLDGFIRLQAREAGVWGNDISVSARKSGPAQYEVSVLFQGGRFESAREVVRGDPLPPLIPELLKPGPMGVYQAKAAGVLAVVTRDGVEPDSAPSTTTVTT